MTPRARARRRASNEEAIRANARMNRKALRGKAEVIMVTNSTGCIYCDLDIESRKVGGVWVHQRVSGYAACTRERAGTQ